MDPNAVSNVLIDAMTVAIKLSAPMLLLGMIIGVIVAIFQAVTQIHEQTIGFVLKLIVVVAVLLVGGHWMLATLQDFAAEIFRLITG